MSLIPLRHKHDRAILAIAIPALGGLAIDPLVSLVDTAFVGQLGKVPLGALGVNAALFSMAFVIFNFLAYGTTPRVGRALGRGDREAAGQVVVQALTLALLTGLIALLVLEIFAEPLLAVMGATGELREPALVYLRIRALAGPAVLLITASHGAFRGYQDTRTPFVVTAGLNLINLVLDPLFIFGLGWGIAGAAWATVIAQWAGAIVFLVLLLKTHRARLGITLTVPRLRDLLPFLRTGGHLFIRTGALVGTTTMATAVAARLGVTEVAAHQVAVQLWAFLALVVDAFAVAGQSLVALHLGRSDAPTAHAIGARLLQWGLGLGLVLGACFWLLRPYLPLLFNQDPEVVALVLDLFVFVAILQPINGLVFVWDGIYMGAEAFGYLAVAMIISATAAILLLLLVHPMGWGMPGIWWAIVALMLIRTATLAVPWAGKKLVA